MTRLPSLLLIASALVAAAPALHAETVAAAAQPPAADAARTLPAITVTPVVRRPMRDRVLASGLVAAVERVEVQPLIEGQAVDALLQDVGDVVAEGAVLARLSPTALTLQKGQFQAQLAAARASVAQAEASLVEAQANADEARRTARRQTELQATGVTSAAAAENATAAATAADARVTVARQSLEAARAQVDLVQAQIADIDLQLARTEVRAPVAGEIVERNARVGAIASAAGGAAMFVMNRDAALEVVADVAEADLVRLARGQRATLHGVGAGAALTGSVRLVEPAIDTTTRLGRVRISIDPGNPVVTGMFIEAEILVTERDALAVPVTAVGGGMDGAVVMRVQGDTVEQTAVKTGIRDGGWIEVTDGLAEGDVVVAKAAAFVRDGDRVNPVPADSN